MRSTETGQVIDLSDGSRKQFGDAPVRQTGNAFSRPTVWAPDSSALYFIDDERDLSVFDTATRAVAKTVVPGVIALAIRPAI